VAGRAGWLGLQSWASAVNEGCNSSRVVRIRLFRYLSILSSFVTDRNRSCEKNLRDWNGVRSGQRPYNRHMIRAAVITVSDSCFEGRRTDVSGPDVVKLLERNGFAVTGHIVVPDEQLTIEDALRDQCELARLVVTTGGTGIGLRDVTPEATRAICDRLLEGFGEVMRIEGRKHTQFAPLSRAVSGTRGSSLIINLPGSPKGAVTSLEAVLNLIPHALTLLEGNGTHHGESDIVGLPSES
jgi:molybdopterin adenylyltransferase